MWANTIPTLSLWSPATVTYRSNRSTVTVSAKPPRPQKNMKYDYDSDETDSYPELETLKQQQQQQQEIGEADTYVSNSDTISGSVVLLALQKASAQKTSKKKKKVVKNIKDDEDNKKQGDVVEDYGDVKPLCVKSDWKDRLDELEMQLHQLIHHT